MFDYVKARDLAFENDDLAWAAIQLPQASSLRVVEMAFHKARYECRNVSEGKRRASQRWLAEHGVKRFGGMPVKVGDPLPV